ncbi:hypothetical protein [Umezakia ovalisporum]|uniref:hypothetical protein n=1 Tax=Umezakia ovalisporum TaxID=75695 RepID=UPI002474F69F|nr:hypothetical protein [Umezakia ovalisporum]MDH6088891.1 hypothetical protein [Umezakia ovalisporum Ak1311]
MPKVSVVIRNYNHPRFLEQPAVIPIPAEQYPTPAQPSANFLLNSGKSNWK